MRVEGDKIDDGFRRQDPGYKPSFVFFNNHATEKMKLPKKKLEEVEYYECYTKNQKRSVKPVVYDKIVLHYGEWEKKWKLFGKWTIWTETVEDRTETFTFKWFRKSKKDEENMYEFNQSKEFLELKAQLEAWFDNEFYEMYKEFCNHEIDYITS